VGVLCQLLPVPAHLLVQVKLLQEARLLLHGGWQGWQQYPPWVALLNL
jgi:hypothetical protein